MQTFDDVRKELVPTIENWIEELEAKLRYTRKTVRRNAIQREILYWKSQTDSVDHESLTRKFFEKYPKWMPKN